MRYCQLDIKVHRGLHRLYANIYPLYKGLERLYWEHPKEIALKMFLDPFQGLQRKSKDMNKEDMGKR
jgi:hypothetical protein